MKKSRKRMPNPRKVVDDLTRVRCKAGIGVVREEVWLDVAGAIVKYNLAFINPLLCNVDNGRVLGYDNAHGNHERHFKGTVTPYIFTNYENVLIEFLSEVKTLREEKP
jgi:hypothetical protein